MSEESLTSQNKEELKRRLELLQEEYERTAQRLQRAERREAIRKHVQNTVVKQNRLLHTSTVLDQSSSSTPEQLSNNLNVPSDTTKVRFCLPDGSPFSTLTCKPNPSRTHRLRSRRSRLRLQVRERESDPEESQEKTREGTEERWNEERGEKDEDVERGRTEEEEKNTEETETVMDGLKRNEENPTTIILPSAAESLCVSQSPSMKLSEGNLPLEDQSAVRTSPPASFYSSSSDRSNRSTDSLGESCSGMVHAAEQTSGSSGMLTSCTLIEGLPFPVEYYIRTTRRMASAHSSVDLNAVIQSQLSNGRGRRRSNRGRGTSRPPSENPPEQSGCRQRGRRGRGRAREFQSSGRSRSLLQSSSSLLQKEPEPVPSPKPSSDPAPESQSHLSSEKSLDPQVYPIFRKNPGMSGSQIPLCTNGSSHLLSSISSLAQGLRTKDFQKLSGLLTKFDVQDFHLPDDEFGQLKLERLCSSCSNVERSCFRTSKGANTSGGDQVEHEETVLSSFPQSASLKSSLPLKFTEQAEMENFDQSECEMRETEDLSNRSVTNQSEMHHNREDVKHTEQIKSHDPHTLSASRSLMLNLSMSLTSHTQSDHNPPVLSLGLTPNVLTTSPSSELMPFLQASDLDAALNTAELQNEEITSGSVSPKVQIQGCDVSEHTYSRIYSADVFKMEIESPEQVNNLPLSPHDSPLSQNNHPLSPHDSPLSQNNPPLSQNNPPLFHHGSPLSQNNPTLSQNNPSLSHHDSQLSQNNPPLSHHGSTLSQNNPPLSHHDSPLSQNNPPLSHHDSQLSQNNPPISHHDSPLSQNNPPLSHHVLQLSQNNPPLTYHGSPLSQNNPPLSHHDSQLSQNNPPLTYHGSPLSQNNPPLSHHDSPLSQNNPPLSHHDSQLSQNNPPLTYHGSPLSQNNPPISHHDSQLSQNNPPISHHDSPLSQNNPPLSHHDSQLSQNNPPLTYHGSPLSQNNPPLSHHDLQLSQYNPPISHHDSPLSQNNPSFSHRDSPLSQNNPSLPYHGSPLSQNNPLLSHHDSQLSQNDPPLSQNNPPLSHHGSPLSQNNPPLFHHGSPLSQNNPPLSHHDSPLSQNNPPLSHHDSPLSQNNPLLSENNPPLSHHGSPLSQNNPPLFYHGSQLSQSNPLLSHHDSPLSQNNSPLFHHGSPLSQNNPPIFDHGSPLSQNNPTLSQSNPPLSHHDSPLSQNNSPLSHHGSPLSQNNPPFFHHGSPLSQHNPPLFQNDLPISQIEQPLSQNGSCLCQNNMGSQHGFPLSQNNSSPSQTSSPVSQNTPLNESALKMNTLDPGESCNISEMDFHFQTPKSRTSHHGNNDTELNNETSALPGVSATRGEDITIGSSLNLVKTHTGGSPNQQREVLSCGSLRKTHSLKALDGGCVLDVCVVRWPSEEDWSVCVAGEWSVCVWKQNPGDQEWSLLYTWTFTQSVISLQGIPDSSALLCVCLGRLEITEARTLYLPGTDSGFSQAELCKGALQAVLAVSDRRVTCCSSPGPQQNIQVFTLAQDGRITETLSLTSTHQTVQTLVVVEEEKDALIGWTEHKSLLIWNMKSAQLLQTIHLAETVSTATCLRGYSYRGALCVLLQQASACHEESSPTLFTLIATNPLTGKRFTLRTITSPSASTERLIDGDVCESALVGVFQSGLAVWSLAGGVACVYANESSEVCRLARWAGPNTLLTGYLNGDVSVYEFTPTGSRARLQHC